MKFLVVCGAGYLGGAVTDLLMKSEYEFRIYDVLLYEEAYRKNVPFVYGDIRDTNKLDEYLDWADTVIWLAALVALIMPISLVIALVLVVVAVMAHILLPRKVLMPVVIPVIHSPGLILPTPHCRMMVLHLFSLL